MPEIDSDKFDQNLRDWYDESSELNDERIEVIKNLFSDLKISGSICYQLLKQFFYNNKTMDQIARLFNYTNADNAKNQKARCQKKFKEMVLNKIKTSD